MHDDTLLPEDELTKMRKEISLLKRQQGISEPGPGTQGDIDKLSRSINSLLEIFKEASDDLKMDTHDAVLVSQKLDNILDRLEKIETQNEKIAKGVVAVADMIEDLQNQSSRRMPSPVHSSPQMPQPQSSQDSQKTMPKPLPTYEFPKQEDKKKSPFTNFKI